MSKISGKSGILFQIVLLIALALPFSIFSSPLSVNGQLHVSGLQLVNECGSPVQLRGISSHGLQWYGLISCMDFCCISASALDYIANNIGADVFRIACYPAENGYMSNPSGFTQQVNNIVQMCEDRGIYAVIDWHILSDGNPNTNIIYARTFWESMALAHKDRRNVIYEICNEPNGVSWSQVVTYANDIIPRIRAIDPDAVIVVGTPNWSQLGAEVVSNKLTFSNIMYAFHFYAATHDTSMLTNYIGQLPIFVTEWAATEASGAGGTNYTRADSYISIMGGANTAGVKLSWCAWSWSEAPETSGMLNPGTCDAANWSSYKPTGSYVVGKVSNPADAFTPCAIATNTPTPAIVPTEVVPATDLRLDNMADGNYVSNICSNWYSYDDSNDCTDKNCVANPHGNSQIVPWSKDHWQDLGLPVQNFFMSQPGRNGGSDFAARITGVVTTTFLYGFAGLGFPLVEPEGPVNISTATGLSFWCKSNQSRTFRLKINAPQAFAGRLDEDMYGYVFTATTSWQKVSIDFSSVLFSQEGWGNTLVTRAMALAKVDTIQWQTQGQTGAPYTFDLWVDDVVLINAPAALKTVAASGCVPPTNTPTWDPMIPTYTFTPTPAYEMRVNAGGTADYTDGAGKVWYTDKAFVAGSWGYEGGGGVAANPGVPVAGTTDDTLYQSERWGNPTYRFTVPNGSYQVTLRLAEMYFTATNMRIFDIVVEGTIAVDNLDLVAIAGAKTARDVTVIVNVTDGRLDITSSGTVDGALINAIAVLGYSPPANTPTRTATRANTNTFTRTATRTFTRTITLTNTPQSSVTNTPVNTSTFTRTATRTATTAATLTNTPTLINTDTRTSTALPTGTSTSVNTATFTRTATNTITMTATGSNTPYYSPTFTATPSSTRTPSFTRTATATFTVTLSNTASPTISQTWTGTPPTSTHSPTITQTAVDTATPSVTVTSSATQADTATNTPVNTATFTWTQSPVSTATYTATTGPSSTNTPVNTATYTQTTGPSPTDTPVNTVTYTQTTGPSPTDTPVNTVTYTTTTGPSSTNTPVNTATYTTTAGPSSTQTPANTATSNPTMAPSATDTPANTHTAIPTATYTHTNTYTQTPTASYTPTNVPADTPTQTPVPVDAENFEITDTLIYPNPYNPELGMNLTISTEFSRKHGNVKVRFYTPALRCIRTYDFPASPWAGKRALNIPASGLEGLANGCYYYVITAEDEEGKKAKSKIPSLIILK